MMNIMFNFSYRNFSNLIRLLLIFLTLNGCDKSGVGDKPSLPDLTVSIPYIPGTVLPGDTLNIQFDVTNVNDVTSTSKTLDAGESNLEVMVLFSSDDGNTWQPVSKLVVPVPEIKPGTKRSNTLSFNLNQPGLNQPGLYQFISIADATNEVNERNESNNEKIENTKQ